MRGRPTLPHVQEPASGLGQHDARCVILLRTRPESVRRRARTPRQVTAESVPSKLGTYQEQMTAFPMFKEQAHPRMAWIYWAFSTYLANTSSICLSFTFLPDWMSSAWVNSGMIIAMPSSLVFRCTPGAWVRKPSQRWRTLAQ